MRARRWPRLNPFHRLSRRWRGSTPWTATPSRLTVALASLLLTGSLAAVVAPPASAAQLNAPDSSGAYQLCNINTFHDTVTHPAGGRWRFYWNCNWGGGKGDTSPYERVAIHLRTQFRGNWQSPTTGFRSPLDTANCATGVGFTDDHAGQTASGCLQIDTGDSIYPNDIACIECSLYSGGTYDFTIAKQVDFSGCWRSASTGGCGAEDPGRVAAWGTADALPPRPADFYPGGSAGPAVLPAKAARGGGSPSMPHGSECECHTSKPVDTATGNFWHTFGDFSVPGRGRTLDLSHTYNSGNAATNGPLGYGWAHSYNMSLTIGSSEIDLNEETGSQIPFTGSGPTYTPLLGVVGSLVHNADGTYTFTRRGTEIFNFDSTGRLMAEKDLNGYTTAITYPSGSQMVVTDPAGRTLTFSYTGTHVTQVADSASPAHSVTFAYNDGAGDLTDVTDQTGAAWHFTYNTTSHLLLTMRRPNQAGAPSPAVLTNTYDSSARVTAQTDELNRTTGFDYTTVPGSTVVTDPAGKKRLQTYAYGVLTSRTDGYGTSQAATWTYTRDPDTLGLKSVTDPNNHSTTMTYDARGNLTSRTDALTHTASAVYNGLNEPTAITDANGVTTTMTYDSAGNLQTTSTPLLNGSGQTVATRSTTLHYDDASHPGDVTSMTDPLGKVTSVTYDATTGLRTGSQAPPTPENAAGDKTTYGYDAPTGLRTSMVSPKGNVTGANPADYTTTYAYDADGRPTTTKEPLWVSSNPTAHRTVRTYDADGNLTQLTDGDNHTTTNHYDAADQLTSVTRPDNSVLSYGYDGDGNRASYTDGASHATTYHYDNAALPSTLTSETDPDNRTTTYGYDGAGNRVSSQDPGGNCSASPATGCTALGYDAAGRLTSITYSDGTTPNVSSITYDNDGHRTAMTDGTGTSHWTWDSLGRMTSSTNGAGAAITYGYDIGDRQTSIAYPGAGTATRSFDDVGRLTSVTDWLSPANTSSFGYDANSNLTTETLPNGVTNTYTFDADDQLTAISDATGSSTVFAATYARDAKGQLSTDTSAPSGTGAYGYTALDQLCYAGSTSGSSCASPPTGATPYGYDTADNLATNGTTTQSFDAANQLCWAVTGSSTNGCASPPSGATTFAYDGRGNRTSTVPNSGSATCDAYDQANRLTAVTSGTGSTCTTPTAAGSYAYDGTGLRSSKTVGVTTTAFAWDQSAGLPTLLQEAAGSATTSYLYGPDGSPLEQVSPSGTPYWYHRDQLGSTRALTDASGGAVDTYTYDAFGNTTASTGSVANPLRYAGQYTDAETGFQYLRARYYDPAAGQWLSRDPLTDVTRQPYAYVGNNPLNATDPSGLILSACGKDIEDTGWNDDQRKMFVQGACSQQSPISQTAPGAPSYAAPDVSPGYALPPPVCDAVCQVSQLIGFPRSTNLKDLIPSGIAGVVSLVIRLPSSAGFAISSLGTLVRTLYDVAPACEANSPFHGSNLVDTAGVPYPSG